MGLFSFLTNAVNSYNKRERVHRRDRRATVSNRMIANDIHGRLADLSVRGCGFVPDESVFQVGQTINLTIIGKYDRQIHVEGRIVSADKDNIVFGLRFTKVKASDMELIKEIVHNAQRREG